MFRNDSGHWLLGFQVKSPSLDILMVEFHALMVGLRLAWDHGFRQIIVETDCFQGLNTVLNGIHYVLPEYRACLADIHELMDRRWSIQLQHIPRSANLLADKMARRGAEEQCELQVLTAPPQDRSCLTC